MIFLWIIFILSVISLGYLVFSKIPALRVIDVTTFPGAKERQLKHVLATRQLEKYLEGLWRMPMRVALRGFAILQNSFRTFAHRVKKLERVYQEQARGKQKRTVDKATLDALAREADALISAQQYEEAEKMLIDILSGDGKYAAAYEMLGRVYIAQKEYDHAHEALRTMLKLRPKDASAQALMGELLRSRGQLNEAFEAFAQAVRLSPKNPKYLDFLIDSAINVKKIDAAREALDKLREVNPENKKIAEYTRKIAT